MATLSLSVSPEPEGMGVAKSSSFCLVATFVQLIMSLFLLPLKPAVPKSNQSSDPSNNEDTLPCALDKDTCTLQLENLGIHLPQSFWSVFHACAHDFIRNRLSWEEVSQKLSDELTLSNARLPEYAGRSPLLSPEKGPPEKLITAPPHPLVPPACVEALTCSVCLEVFSSPQLLPCSHNLCAGCLNALPSLSMPHAVKHADKDRAESRKKRSHNTAFVSCSEDDSSIVQCPLCRSAFARGEARQNIVLREIMTAMALIDPSRTEREAAAEAETETESWRKKQLPLASVSNVVNVRAHAFAAGGGRKRAKGPGRVSLQQGLSNVKNDMGAMEYWNKVRDLQRFAPRIHASARSSPSPSPSPTPCSSDEESSSPSTSPSPLSGGESYVELLQVLLAERPAHLCPLVPTSCRRPEVLESLFVKWLRSTASSCPCPIAACM